ncbi:hypothetical protein BD779DRAFT_1555236 [Infundibulicybe gibba]|nr:hypothetical protein BD779DRAFT_1568022 [Infundibulicybe gibba]KAF8878234.1 hypothetical protein BD779DRAFT_1555236 [Infundibulicybe gibba]
MPANRQHSVAECSTLHAMPHVGKRVLDVVGRQDRMAQMAGIELHLGLAFKNREERREGLATRSPETRL